MWPEFIDGLCTYSEHHRGKSGTHKVSKGLQSKVKLNFADQKWQGEGMTGWRKKISYIILVEKEINYWEHLV